MSGLDCERWTLPAPAARAAGQTQGVAHMGPHALRAAAYAATAVALAASDRQAPRCDEVRWSLGHLAADA
ncbi:putative immunity protein [Mycobacterium avium]|uniref:putative immunity protein n=1 Tax=Mycobacterium avium TaxID=1764 RepID=UPI0034CF507E